MVLKTILFVRAKHPHLYLYLIIKEELLLLIFSSNIENTPEVDTNYPPMPPVSEKKIVRKERKKPIPRPLSSDAPNLLRRRAVPDGRRFRFY